MRPAPRSSRRRVPAASKVDLPEPGTPVTRVKPRRRSQASTISSSIPSSSKLGGAPGSTLSVMLTAKPPAACTGERLQRKRRKTPRASATACEQSMARPPRRMPSPVASKMRAHKLPSPTPSSAAPVARASLPSTSMKAGAPVWKEMSEEPRFAAHSRKASSRSTGNTCAASGQYALARTVIECLRQRWFATPLCRD